MKVQNTFDMVDKVSAISNFVDFAITRRKDNYWSSRYMVSALTVFKAQYPSDCAIVCKYYDYDMFCDRDDLYNLVNFLVCNIEIDNVSQTYVNNEIAKFVLNDRYDYPYHDVIK